MNNRTIILLDGNTTKLVEKCVDIPLNWWYFIISK